MREIKRTWCKRFHNYLWLPNDDWSKLVCPRCGAEHLSFSKEVIKTGKVGSENICPHCEDTGKVSVPATNEGGEIVDEEVMDCLCADVEN